MEKIDLSLVKALIKKQWQERISAFKKGNFDVIGFLLRLVLIGVFIAVFVVFFGKFFDIYLSIKLNGQVDPLKRAFELLSICYSAILIFITIAGIGHINRSIFEGEDLNLFAAMPINANTLFVSKIMSIYISQLLFALVTIIPVNLTIGIHVGFGFGFYTLTALMCLLLPIISIAFAAILVLPYRYIKKLLKPYFIVNFILITVITAALFYLYFILINGIKELLLGDSLKYFFDQNIMTKINIIATYIYPSSWLANILVHKSMVSFVCVLLLLVLCFAIAMLTIKRILTWVLQARVSGNQNFKMKKRKIGKKSNVFFSLIKKEFLQIFRTPSYAFSYFSVAVIVPIMVYFCMSIGSSLIVKLVGINANKELAIFLTLLFSSLSNVFCATNISREGQNFYCIKAMPIKPYTFIFSKVVLCLIVATFSQILSAVVLVASGFVGGWVALFVFAVGLLFSFAQICVATNYDFKHAKFPADEDCLFYESSNTSSLIVVLGLMFSMIIGGGVLAVKLVLSLRGFVHPNLTFVFVGSVAILFAMVSFIYLIANLNKRYYKFAL